MEWRRSSPQTESLLGLILIFMTITHTSAQTCPSDPNIEIAFPEHDPTGSVTPGSSDPAFYQPLPIFGESFTVTIGPDTTRPNSFPFDQFFTYAYDAVSGRYIVVMTKGIDRDGSLPIVDDDINLLQYQVVCRETAFSSELYSILKIQITDVNDNAPQFQNSPYFITVNELTPIGLTVFRQISATDRDEGANRQIEYKLSDAPGAEFSGISFFALPSVAEGFLSVAGTLDFESMYRAANYESTRMFYNITITATDSGYPRRSGTTSIVIRISDGDDLGPEFLYPSCIPSSEQFGRACLAPKYSSSIPSGTSGDTPLVFTPDPIDQSNPGGTVDIVMQDRDTLNATVICNITQTRPAGYESYFKAMSTPLSGSGKQHRCAVTYTVPSGQPPISRNTVPELELVVEATEDNFSRRQDYATITLTFTQTNNNNPMITSTSTFGYIYENTPARSLVAGNAAANTTLQLIFTDPDMIPSDPQPEFDISWSSGTPFAVNPDGSVYLVTPSLDYESTRVYQLTVTITERTPERRSGTIDLTINVLDVNDNKPVFLLTNYQVSLLEGDYTNGRDIVTVAATDKDFGPVTFSGEVSPANAAPLFTVSPNGLITLHGQVNAGQIFIYVTASDSGSPPMTAVAVVVVTVIPMTTDFAPHFSADLYIIDVSEGVGLNSYLFVVPVNDPDTNAADLTFTLSNEVPAFNPPNLFMTNNGAVLINRRLLDRETNPEHNVTVTVRDPQGNADTALIIIRVTDINDNNPEFGSSEYVFSVVENLPVGTFLGSITATDLDAPGPNSAVTYGIISSLDAYAFAIDATTGQLSTTTSFDYEVQRQYQILVRASDSAGSNARTSVTPVTVNVLDVEDSVPLFRDLAREVTVREDISTGTVILQLPATDPDVVDNINFILENLPGLTDADTFSVQNVGNNATITLRTPLNYEAKNRYVFRLTTDDGQNSGVPFTSVEVTVVITPATCVTAQTMGGPRFSADIYVIDVSEGTTFYSHIFTLPATDPDTSAAELTYTLSNEVPAFTPPNPFLSHTGATLINRRLFDRETFPEHNVTVTVRDPEGNTDTAFVIIRITDINDNNPVFGQSAFVFNVGEYMPPGTFVGNVTATDADQPGPNSDVTYGILNTLDASSFIIDYRTGQLTTARPFDSVFWNQYQIVVKASDVASGNARSSVVPVTINVLGN